MTAVVTRRVVRGAFAAAAIGLVAVIAIGGRSSERAPEVMTLVVEPQTLHRTISAEGTLDAEKSTPIGVPTEAQQALKIGWIAEDQSAVKKGDVLVRFDPTDLEENLRRGSTDRTKSDNSIGKSVASSDAQKHGLERDAKHAEFELDMARRFRRDDTELYSRFEQIESQIDESLAGERKEYADDVRGIRSRIATAERDLLEIEKRKADLVIDRAQRGLDSLIVTAPHDGIIVLERDWRGDVPRVGATVWPGRPIAEIPELGAMKAEIWILEADATGVAVGQKATVSVESAPGVIFPAKVTRVDKVAKPRMRGVPVQYFGVTLALERSSPSMKPGARVRATIEVANRKDALVVPRQAVFDVKGERVVYVKRAGEFKPAKVQVGDATPGRIVILSGLKKGDEIALTDPKRDGQQPERSAS